MDLVDVVTIDFTDTVRTTVDGYLAASPRVARTGIQIYAGRELGRPDLAQVRVYRPESEVFSKDSLGSFAFRPITNDHPSEPVTSANWRRHSVGVSDGTVARDGEFVRVPMLVMDQGAIDAWRGGKAQLSVGYSADIKWADGQTPDGQQYDAIQTKIRANHIAIVGAARGGPKLRIGDDDIDELADEVDIYWDADYTPEARRAMAKTGEAMPNGGYPIRTEADLANAISAFGRNPTAAVKAHIIKRAKAMNAEAKLPGDWLDESTNGSTRMNDKITPTKIADVGGVQIEMSDIAHQVVGREIAGLNAKLTDATAKAAADKATADASIADLTTKLADATTAKTTQDAEVATLKQQLKDAELTPAKLDAAVKDRQSVVGRARGVLGDKLIHDGKTAAEIMRQVVDSKMGATAKDWKDDAIKTSFDTLTAGVKSVDALATDLSHGGNVDDAAKQKPYQKYDADISNRWKGKQPAAAAAAAAA